MSQTSMRLRTRRSQPPRNRSELFSLLSEACELEHGLACSYLYTAFTLKQDQREGGISWEQLQLVRKWAAQIYFVASEEMLHLGQAWNLLAAIGGTPYYFRPNFPQNAKYYPIEANLLLEPFGLHAMQRFVFYERPQNASPAEVCADQLGISQEGLNDPEYSSVGELYSLIRAGFECIPENRLFLGRPDRQVGRDLVDFPDIIKVFDRETAFRAIDMIVEQGEGNPRDPLNSHYGAFMQVKKEYESELAAATARGEAFLPARRAAVNPVARERGDYGGDLDVRFTYLREVYTRSVSELFDEIYMLMLRMLQFVFNNPTADRAHLEWFSRTAIGVMPVVVKPLGEALTMLPSGADEGEVAGPSFAMSRHVPLPADVELAQRIATERLEELILVAEELATAANAPKALAAAASNLRRFRAR
jgi:hypothetical protein